MTKKPRIVSGLRPTTQLGNNPKDRYGMAKVDFGVIPHACLVVMAQGMMNGASKYGDHNYRVEPVQGKVYLGAALRHLLALYDGEDYDPATGIHHVGFIMSTVGIYFDAMVNGMLIDNRPLPGKTGELITLFNLEPGKSRTPAETRKLLEDYLLRVQVQKPARVKRKHARKSNVQPLVLDKAGFLGDEIVK